MQRGLRGAKALPTQRARKGMHCAAYGAAYFLRLFSAVLSATERGLKGGKKYEAFGHENRRDEEKALKGGTV